MASGIEIVGLILAVIPLFVSAAEHYGQAKSLLKRAIKKEQFAARYKDELIQQKALLILYVKGIVGRTNLPAQIQQKLVSDPTGETWKRPEVVKQISAELADAYNPFLHALQSIAGALAGIVKDDTGQVPDEVDIVKRLQELCLQQDQPPASGSSGTKVLERLKFSCNSVKREEILYELKECTKALERLSSAADRAKPFARKQQSRRVHVAYEYRELMQRLFGILQKACKFSRTDERPIGLRLQVHADELDNAPESTFQIVMFLSQDVIIELSAKLLRAATKDPPKKKVRILDNAHLLCPGMQTCKSSETSARRSLTRTRASPVFSW